jgi:hypothetical protein
MLHKHVYRVKEQLVQSQLKGTHRREVLFDIIIDRDAL